MTEAHVGCEKPGDASGTSEGGALVLLLLTVLLVPRWCFLAALCSGSSGGSGPDLASGVCVRRSRSEGAGGHGRPLLGW